MRGVVVTVALGIFIASLLVTIAHQNFKRFHRPLVTTTYQAVTLLNGQVFYGRIDHLGTDYPVLRDAFVLESQRTTQSEESKLVLVKQTETLTGADHIIFPASAIAFVEPVRVDSVVDKLIKGAGLSR